MAYLKNNSQMFVKFLIILKIYGDLNLFLRKYKGFLSIIKRILK